MPYHSTRGKKNAQVLAREASSGVDRRHRVGSHVEALALEKQKEERPLIDRPLPTGRLPALSLWLGYCTLPLTPAIRATMGG